MINKQKAYENAIRVVANSDKIKFILEQIDICSNKGKSCFEYKDNYYIELTEMEIKYLETLGFNIKASSFQTDIKNNRNYCKISWI